MIASIGLVEVPHSPSRFPLSAIVVPLPSEPDSLFAGDGPRRIRAGRLVVQLFAQSPKLELPITIRCGEEFQPGERVVAVGSQLLKDGDPPPSYSLSRRLMAYQTTRSHRDNPQCPQGPSWSTRRFSWVCSEGFSYGVGWLHACPSEGP